MSATSVADTRFSSAKYFISFTKELNTLSSRIKQVLCTCLKLSMSSFRVFANFSEITTSDSEAGVLSFSFWYSHLLIRNLDKFS